MKSPSKKHRIIIELRHTEKLAAAALAARGKPERVLDTGVVPKLPGVHLDESFSPVFLPALKPRAHSGDAFDISPLVEVDRTPENGTYLVRGEVDEMNLDKLDSETARAGSVVGIFADISIGPAANCPGAPVGTDANVEGLLGVPSMRRCRMDGRGVLVAIVDSGIDLAHLNSRGKTPALDASRSWTYRGGTPGQMLRGHGTITAYDVCIAAPNCTLLDIVLLGEDRVNVRTLDARLSDATRAYEHLINLLTNSSVTLSLVVNNSWQMYHPGEDFPPKHPMNYSDNPEHPFYKSVTALSSLGADILFAAGNCGPDCPVDECKKVTTNAIYGAHSHPDAYCVAGVDINKQRVGYSNIGPGRITKRKPDIAGYTEFKGSGVHPADKGTSAACPVVAGVVAAVRSVRPYNPAYPASSPTSIRALLTSTAEDLGAAGYDFMHGYGVVNGGAIARKFCPEEMPTPTLCDLMPWLCEDTRTEPFPDLEDIPDPRRFQTSIPGFDVASLVHLLQGRVMGNAIAGGEVGPFNQAKVAALLSYYAGYYAAQQRGAAQPKVRKCGCGGS